MSTKVTCEGRTITLTFDDDFEVAQVHAALMHRQWLRIVKGQAELSDVDTEPKCSDHDRLVAGAVAPIFPTDPGPPRVVQIQPASELEKYRPGCYVQHLGAYLPYRNYEVLYRHMIDAGFSLLRSPRGTTSNKYWEIWYLPSLTSLTGPMKDADRKTLVNWLFHTVQPGTVSFDGESWALSVE